MAAVNPADDPTWPICHDCPIPEGADPTKYLKHWCASTRQFLLEGRDASHITWGLRYCIPIAPEEDWWAEVSIATEKLAGISGMLYLIKRNDAFSTEEEEVSLGLWTQGEGRASMSYALNSWIDSQDTEKCTWRGHGFEEEMKWQALQKSANSKGKKIDRWCLAYYGCCSICWAFGNAASQQAVADMNAATYGITTSTVGGSSSWNTGGTTRQQAIANQLTQKYGNRQVLHDGRPADITLNLPNQNFHE